MKSVTSTCQWAGAVVFASACVLALSLLARSEVVAQQEKPAGGRRGLLSPQSDPHAVMVNLFEHSGWNVEDAVILTENGFARLGIPGYVLRPEPAMPDDRTATPMAPDVDVHETLLNAFVRSGWSPSEALDHTDYILIRSGLPLAKALTLSMSARIKAADADGAEADSRWSKSSAHAIMARAFESSGWSRAHAVVLARNSLARQGVPGYEAAPEPPMPQLGRQQGKALLSPATDAYATILGAFRAGGANLGEAIKQTEAVLVAAGLSAMREQQMCQVRKVSIQFCQDGNVINWFGYVKNQCYWQLFPSESPCPSAECTTPGQVHWHTMHATAGCAIGARGCMHVRFEEEVHVSCTNPLVVTCTCFEETSCADIDEVQCCEPLNFMTGAGGCDHCPCEEP